MNYNYLSNIFINYFDLCLMKMKIIVTVTVSFSVIVLRIIVCFLYYHQSYNCNLKTMVMCSFSIFIIIFILLTMIVIIIHSKLYLFYFISMVTHLTINLLLNCRFFIDYFPFYVFLISNLIETLFFNHVCSLLKVILIKIFTKFYLSFAAFWRVDYWLFVIVAITIVIILKMIVQVVYFYH
jgi:hypothetical protein